MTPNITVLTLGVDDLARSLVFYRDGLGFPTQGIIGQELTHGAVAFFNLQPGLKLALWPRASIAADTGMTVDTHAPTHAPMEFTIGHNVASSAEVDTIMARASRAGAFIVKAAGPTFYGGYAGYFQDPDGHLWEVVFNPGLASLG